MQVLIVLLGTVFSLRSVLTVVKKAGPCTWASNYLCDIQVMVTSTDDMWLQDLVLSPGHWLRQVIGYCPETSALCLVQIMWISRENFCVHSLLQLRQTLPGCSLRWQILPVGCQGTGTSVGGHWQYLSKIFDMPDPQIFTGITEV